MKIVTASEVYLLNGEYKTYVIVDADTISDVTPPDPSWLIGSMCWDITNKKIYKLNSSGVWVEQ